MCDPLTAKMLSKDNKIIHNHSTFWGDSSYIIHQMHAIDCPCPRENGAYAHAAKTLFFLQKVVISVTVCTVYTE